MDENTMIRPAKGDPVWVVQSVMGRDRKRVFLAFRTNDEPPVHGRIPSIYTVNGSLRRVECPKKKHLAHVKVIGTLTREETELLFSDYSNKTAAMLVQKYDKYGELYSEAEKRADSY